MATGHFAAVRLHQIQGPVVAIKALSAFADRGSIADVPCAIPRAHAVLLSTPVINPLPNRPLPARSGGAQDRGNGRQRHWRGSGVIESRPIAVLTGRAGILP